LPNPVINKGAWTSRLRLIQDPKNILLQLVDFVLYKKSAFPLYIIFIPQCFKITQALPVKSFVEEVPRQPSAEEWQNSRTSSGAEGKLFV
jgi:hypothetical protein